MKKLLLPTIIALTLSSCTGLKFTPISYNKTIPDDLKNRTFWNETDLFKYNLDQLTGSIIYVIDTSNNLDRGPRFVSEENPPTLEVIDKGELYHSKINRNIQSNVSVLEFATSLNTSQMVDIKITDIIQSFIDWEHIPIEKIEEFIKNQDVENVKRYYVQGALLTSITKQYSKKIEANAKGVAGGAYGVSIEGETTVFNEESDYIQDYRISLALIDLNKLELLLSASPLKEDKNQKIATLKSALSEEINIKSIKGF